MCGADVRRSAAGSGTHDAVGTEHRTPFPGLPTKSTGTATTIVLLNAAGRLHAKCAVVKPGGPALPQVNANVSPDDVSLRKTSSRLSTCGFTLTRIESAVVSTLKLSRNTSPFGPSAGTESSALELNFESDKLTAISFAPANVV